MPPKVFGAIGALAMGLAMASAHAGGDTGALPADAWKVIQQVDRAAAAKNWSQLRSLMADDFTWSFGGDGNADQAITAWKEEPGKYLAELRRVLTKACGRRDQYFDGQEHVSCPGKTDMGFRAGFTLAKDGWKMRYFVAGD
jgi:hypothetical protein